MSESFIPLSLVKDKVECRRRIVFRLAVNGLQQKEISKKLHCCLSTIEKDFHFLRENMRSESIVCDYDER